MTATHDVTAAPGQPALFEPAEPASDLSAEEAAAWAAAVDGAEAAQQLDELRARAARERTAVAGQPEPLPPDPQLRPGVLLGPAVQTAMADDGLHPVEREILTWVAVLVDGDPAGGTDRGLTGIARLMGRRSSSAIYRQINRLEELGWIARQRRQARHGVIERRAMLRPGPRWTALVGADTAPDAATVPCRARTAIDCYGRASAKFGGVCSRCREHDAALAAPARPQPPPPMAPVASTVADVPDDVVDAADGIAAVRAARQGAR